jgi:NAD(P)-dependent dehydrogenase (short-subunit alcohol dehydrogenase family)
LASALDVKEAGYCLFFLTMNIRKVFVVTGGARGIGRVLVEKLASVPDWGVSTCDVLPFHQTAGGSGIEEEEDRENVHRQYCDVSQEDQVQSFIQTTVQKFGRIDCLINNAAVAHPYIEYDRLEDLDVHQFQRILQVNLVGPILLCKHCVPYLRRGAQQREGASIINMSSTRAHMSEPKSEGYAASKGGIESMTHALAISLQHDNIRVNAIAPGWIHVDDNYPHSQQDEEFHPVRRVGNAIDIFEMCIFLSDATKSGFITGQTIIVDGGVTRKMIYPE